MKKASRELMASSVLWAARIWGSLILAFVLFFLVASFFGEWGEGLRDPRELLVFLAFPVSTIVGLAVAWRREGLGGLITTIGMIIAFALRPDLIRQLFFSVGVLGPGILYLAYWALTGMVRAKPLPGRSAI